LLYFLELKRRNNDLFYYSNDFKYDFLVKNIKKIKQAIQVCYDFNKENEKREIKGIIKAMEKYNLEKAKSKY
jgi:predicted AAA+ superfamily ATPase